MKNSREIDLFLYTFHKMFVKFHEICFKDKMFEDINDEFSNSNSYRNSEIVVDASPCTYDLKIQNIVSTLLQKTIFSEVKKIL